MPSPKITEVTMDWNGACKAMLNGQRVSRLDPNWDNGSFYCLLHQGRLRLHKSDGKLYVLDVSDADMLATDWYSLDVVASD